MGRPEPPVVAQRSTSVRELQVRGLPHELPRTGAAPGRVEQRDDRGAPDLEALVTKRVRLLEPDEHGDRGGDSHDDERGDELLAPGGGQPLPNQSGKQQPPGGDTHEGAARAGDRDAGE